VTVAVQHRISDCCLCSLGALSFHRAGQRTRRSAWPGLSGRSTARRVVRFVRGDTVAQRLRQQIRNIRAADGSRELVRNPTEVARTLCKCRHVDETRIDSLAGTGSLIITPVRCGHPPPQMGLAVTIHG
jgi:hypothetical protein